MAKIPLWEALDFSQLGKTWSVTVGTSFPNLPDCLAPLSCNHGTCPSYSERWGEGEFPLDTWVPQSCSHRDCGWTAPKIYIGWFFDLLQGLVGEERDSGIKATEIDTPQHIWETKQKANLFGTVSPAVEAIPQMAKPSQFFQYGNRSHSFVGDFFPPIFPKMDSSYRRLLFIQGH